MKFITFSTTNKGYKPYLLQFLPEIIVLGSELTKNGDNDILKYEYILKSLEILDYDETVVLILNPYNIVPINRNIVQLEEQFQKIKKEKNVEMIVGILDSLHIFKKEYNPDIVIGSARIIRKYIHYILQETEILDNKNIIKSFVDANKHNIYIDKRKAFFYGNDVPLKIIPHRKKATYSFVNVTFNGFLNEILEKEYKIKPNYLKLFLYNLYEVDQKVSKVLASFIDNNKFSKTFNISISNTLLSKKIIKNRNCFLDKSLLENNEKIHTISIISCPCEEIYLFKLAQTIIKQKYLRNFFKEYVNNFSYEHYYISFNNKYFTVFDKKYLCLKPIKCLTYRDVKKTMDIEFDRDMTIKDFFKKYAKHNFLIFNLFNKNCSYWVYEHLSQNNINIDKKIINNIEKDILEYIGV